MPSRFPNEFVYQVVSLLLAFILVHAIFVALVRPQAELDARAIAAQLEAEPEREPTRSFYIVIKDYEQEACFVLMLWALAILGYKGRAAWRQQKLLGEDVLRLPEGLPIGPEDTRELSRTLESLPATQRHGLLPRALQAAIERFAATGNVQDVSTATRDLCGRHLLHERLWNRPSLRPGVPVGRKRQCPGSLQRCVAVHRLGVRRQRPPPLSDGPVPWRHRGPISWALLLSF